MGVALVKEGIQLTKSWQAAVRIGCVTVPALFHAVIKSALYKTLYGLVKEAAKRAEGLELDIGIMEISIPGHEL